MYSNQIQATVLTLRWRKYLVVLGVLLLLWGAFLMGRNLLFFRISSTDPNMNRVAGASAYIDIYFSKDIVASSLSLRYSEPFVHKTEIGRNKVRLDVQTQGLEAGRTYIITVVRVDSSGGKHLRNQRLVFTAKDIPVSKLSGKQQQALLNKQDHYPYQVQYVAFSGFDQLLDRGVSAEQLQTIKDSIFNYTVAVKQQFWVVKLNSSSVLYQIHNPEAADLNDHLSFKIGLGGASFNVNATLDPIDNTASLQLMNAAGAVVYDSLGSGHD